VCMLLSSHKAFINDETTVFMASESNNIAIVKNLFDRTALRVLVNK
jgi:hypothetical protein